MNKMENKEKKWDEEEDEIQIVDIVFEYIRHWKWFVASLAVCLIAGVIIYLITPKQYNSSISILLEEEKGSSKPAMDMEMLSQGLFSTTSNIDNEIAIVSSPDLMKIVIDSLNLQTSYYRSSFFKKEELYTRSPFVVKHSTLDIYKFGRADFFILKDGDAYVVEGIYYGRDGSEHNIEERFNNIPHTFNVKGTDILLYFSLTGSPLTESEKCYVVINNISATTGSLVNDLSVNTTSKASSVLNINLPVNNVGKGNAILEELVKQYNLLNVRNKNQMAYNTALFINDRLSEISRELGSAEEDVVEYRQEHKITDPTIEAELLVRKTGENEDKLMDLDVQVKILSFAEQFVNNPENSAKIIPNIGVSDVGLAQIITEYNSKIIGADALIKSTGAENPARIRILKDLDYMKQSISSSLSNVKKTYDVSKKDLLKQSSSTQSRILSVPRQERGLVEKVREQKIKENLFMFLMQKREENNLAIASTPDKARVIVSPQKIVFPSSPKLKIIGLAALLLGLVLPVAGIYIAGLFRTQIRNRTELEKLTTISVIGEIANNKSKTETIEKHHNDGTAEMFRALRNNLNFIFGSKDHNTILVTSTMPGEGKTYISANLALSFAFTGKKVLLVGADIRNPQLARYFTHLTKQRGLSDYLTTSDDKWESHVHTSNMDECLHVMIGGTVPPHPNELLMNKRLKDFMKAAKQKYDIVILDTAPVGMVSDTYLITEGIDLTLYVAREGVTPKNAVNFINLQKEEGRLHNMYLVLNDTKYAKDYRYGYGKVYGYGNDAKK